MRIVLALACALVLSGCATLGAIGKVGDELCKRQDSARWALTIALHNAALIDDAPTREATIKAIQVSLDALDRCPEG